MPTRRRSGRGDLFRLLVVLVVVVAALAGATAFFAPWGFYMGGRFHWFPSWQGWGRLHSNSAGGDYAIYIYMYPKGGRGMGMTHVAGNGVLCTPRGERIKLTLGGDFEKHMGVDTNGKTASFYMHKLSPVSLMMGQSLRPELELRGKWNNPDLVLDDHSSIQRNFDHNAQLYPDGKNRPYLGEVSPVTLREGSMSDFEATCKAVKTR